MQSVLLQRGTKPFPCCLLPQRARVSHDLKPVCGQHEQHYYSPRLRWLVRAHVPEPTAKRDSEGCLPKLGSALPATSLTADPLVRIHRGSHDEQDSHISPVADSAPGKPESDGRKVITLAHVEQKHKFRFHPSAVRSFPLFVVPRAKDITI